VADSLSFFSEHLVLQAVVCVDVDGHARTLHCYLYARSHKEELVVME
jgi:hypothetical protein